MAHFPVFAKQLSFEHNFKEMLAHTLDNVGIINEI